MTKALIWYIVGSYAERIHFERSVEAMRNYKWIARFYSFEPFMHKIINGYDYGSGFDKSVEKGGFNEVDARNYALKMAIDRAKHYGVEWVIQCDADEFYTESLGEELENAWQSGFKAININCNHFWDLHTLIAPYGDPHIRILAASTNAQWIQNPNKEHLKNKINKTIDCVLDGYSIPKQLSGMYHIHTHDMFPDKRRENMFVKPQKSDYIFPENYRKDFEEAWNASK